MNLQSQLGQPRLQLLPGIGQLQPLPVLGQTQAQALPTLGQAQTLPTSQLGGSPFFNIPPAATPIQGAERVLPWTRESLATIKLLDLRKIVSQLGIRGLSGKSKEDVVNALSRVPLNAPLVTPLDGQTVRWTPSTTTALPSVGQTQQAVSSFPQTQQQPVLLSIVQPVVPSPVQMAQPQVRGRGRPRSQATTSGGQVLIIVHYSANNDLYVIPRGTNTNDLISEATDYESGALDTEDDEFFNAFLDNIDQYLQTDGLTGLNVDTVISITTE